MLSPRGGSIALLFCAIGLAVALAGLEISGASALLLDVLLFVTPLLIMGAVLACLQPGAD